MLLFVYGSLMKNQENYFLFKVGRAKFVAKGYIKGRLYDLGVGFPAAAEEEGEIYGELYEVSEELLSDIDELEGYYIDHPKDSLYIRKTVSVRAFSKEIYEAEVYYMSLDKLKGFFTVAIEGGRWA